ncbi:hypothetical protein EJB05_37370 [Eragrostis curvula]|uniref:Uncharacterized protein n=1 Tax=Eragrostis curvula TaxID=38414 RepID=A0A5J9TTA6_9POAL|nr:hypothetical protein EJB05_37370 [Eragrostis curvula]
MLVVAIEELPFFTEGLLELPLLMSGVEAIDVQEGELNCSVIHSTRQFKMKRHHSNARCGFTSSGHHITGRLHIVFKVVFLMYKMALALKSCFHSKKIKGVF